MKHPITTLAAAVALACAPVAAHAATGGDYFITIDGTTTTDYWLDLSSSGTGSVTGIFPGTSTWTANISSQSGSNGDAYLSKVSNGAGGGPYTATGSIYYGGYSSTVNYNGGTLAVTSTAIADLANVVFQIEIGEAWTYDFYNHELPALTYYIGENAYTLAATVSLMTNQEYAGTVPMPSGDEDVYINTYLLQWDFTGIENVDSLEITFTGVQHAQLYALQLDQGTTFSVVPEPSTYALILGGVAFAGVAFGRRRRA